MLAAASLPAPSARACGPRTVGLITVLDGQAMALRRTREHALSIGADVLERDVVKTGEDSFVEMLLGADTTIRLGPMTDLLIDAFMADIPGTFDLSKGAMFLTTPKALSGRGLRS